MGLLKRKQSLTASPSPTRLRALPDGDLYLFLESSLMNAQQGLAEYRTSDFIQRPALLGILEEHLNGASLGVQEMLSRL